MVVDDRGLELPELAFEIIGMGITITITRL